MYCKLHVVNWERGGGLCMSSKASSATPEETSKVAERETLI